MKVIKNYFWNVSYQLFAIIIPILIIPYINTHLGPSGVGVNSYTNSLAQMFTIFGDLGVANYGTKIIAEAKNNRLKLSRIFINITFMRLLTILISYIIFLIFSFFQGQYFKFYTLQGILILASAFDISWFFMGIENFKIVSIRNFIIRILTLFLIFIFVKNKSDLSIYIIIMSMSNLIGNLSMFPLLKGKIGRAKLSLISIEKHLKYAFIFFIPQIAMQIYQTLDKFIIGKLINVNASGFFDNSDKIMNILLTIISSMSAVMLPHISNILKKNNIKEMKKQFYRYFDVVLFLSFPMTAGVSSISLKFAPWFFGSSFNIVGPLMMIESLTIVIIGISLAFSSYFLSTNQIKQYNVAIILGAFVSLTIGIYLIYKFGILGSMWSAVLTEFVISSYELYLLRNQLSYKKLFANIKYYFIGSIMLFLIVLFLNINLYFNIYTFILEIIVGILIYSIFIIFSKPPIFYLFKSLLFKLINIK